MRRPNVNSSRRLELRWDVFVVKTRLLRASGVGELLAMLMAEVGCEPIPSSKDPAVIDAFSERRSYSRIKGSLGRESLSIALRKEIIDRDEWTCQYCGRLLIWDTYHCDHVVPVSRGGGDDTGNLAASCEACNRSKGAKSVDEWKRSR